MRNQKKIIEVIEGLGFRQHTSNPKLWFKPVGPTDRYGVDMSGMKPVAFKFEGTDHITDESEPVIKETMDAINTALKPKPKEEPAEEKPTEQLSDHAEESPSKARQHCALCKTIVDVDSMTPVGVPESHYVCKECTEKITSGEIKIDDWYQEQESIAVDAIPEKHQPIPQVVKDFTKAQRKANEIVTTTTPQIPQIAPSLDMETIKKYICPTATDKEAFAFMQLCKARNLNPFTKEAYLLKYGNGAATMVVGKDAFTRRAEDSPQFDGFEAGIITEYDIESKTHINEHEGTFMQSDEKLVGGWAKVYRKDHKYPVTARVSMKEYSTGKSSWAKIPATMIRKVALVQALRESFPSDLGGCYDSSEMDTEIE